MPFIGNWDCFGNQQSRLEAVDPSIKNQILYYNTSRIVCIRDSIHHRLYSYFTILLRPNYASRTPKTPPNAMKSSYHPRSYAVSLFPPTQSAYSSHPPASAYTHQSPH